MDLPMWSQSCKESEFPIQGKPKESFPFLAAWTRKNILVKMAILRAKKFSDDNFKSYSIYRDVQK